MCDFCHQHGEGKKWYLNANNYAEDLMSDLRRRRFITRFFEDPGHLAKGERALTALDVLPGFLWKGVRTKITAKQQVKHFGQVVPIEDIERILALTTSVVRLACICRHVSTGKEQRYCFGVSMEPNGGGDRQAPRRDRRVLSRRAAHGRPRIDVRRPTPWPGSGRASTRAIATRSGRSSRRSWRASATARCRPAMP